MTLALMAVGILMNLFQTPEPGARHELVLKLRYPDGRPAVGLAVSLFKLPDHTRVGWQNTDSACQTDARGLCVWQLFGGLYEFSLPEGTAPDPITLTELGEGGLNNLSVFLDRDYEMGMVLADPLSGASGHSLFFDRTPDEPVPQFVVPGPEDARQHHLVPTPANQGVVVDLDPGMAVFGATAPRAVAVELAADGAAADGAAEAASLAGEETTRDSGGFIPLVLLMGLMGLAALILFLYRYFLTAHDSASTRRRVGDEEDAPWA